MFFYLFFSEKLTFFKIILNKNYKVVVRTELGYFCVLFNFIQKYYGKIWIIEIVNSKKSSYGTFRTFFDVVSSAAFFNQYDFGN